MSGKAVLNRFIEKNPLAVMTRSIIGCVIGEEFDTVFEENRRRQYDDKIKFSTVAMSMAEIALGTVENRNQAYSKYKEELQTSSVAYYGKLNRIEPRASPRRWFATVPPRRAGCLRSSTFNHGKCFPDIAAFRSMETICRKQKSD